MNLTDFLLARYDEVTPVNHLRFEVRDGIPRNYVIADEVSADLEVKRRIVQEYAKLQAEDYSEWLTGSPNADPVYAGAIDTALNFAVCVLALPYADHPDYDEAWRP